MYKKIKLKCKVCVKSFLRKSYEVRRCHNNHWKIYCSVKCQNKGKIGKKFTEQHKLNLRKAQEKSFKERPRRKRSLTREIMKCDICDKSFLRKPSDIRKDNHRKTYCGYKCMRKGQKQIINEIRCSFCSKSFSRISTKIKISKNYCSLKCVGLGSITRKKLKCEICGNYFIRKLSAIKNCKNNYCSLSCNRKRMTFPKKDSSIEIKIQNFLKRLQIEFYTHQGVNADHYYQCDILIPSMRRVIECDGDYWHGNLKKYGDWNNLSKKQQIQKIKDYLRTAELESKEYAVLRLWEDEIKNMDKKDLYNKLKKDNLVIIP